MNLELSSSDMLFRFGISWSMFLIVILFCILNRSQIEQNFESTCSRTLAMADGFFLCFEPSAIRAFFRQLFEWLLFCFKNFRDLFHQETNKATWWVLSRPSKFSNQLTRL